MKRLIGDWHNVSTNNLGISFRCGYCGTNSGPSHYYFLNRSDVKAYIYICPTCNRPTYINDNYGEQVPGPIFGDDIEYLPDDIEKLYNEARKCISVNAYTSAVLSCRKLLMNIAVSKGAEEGKNFVYYVSFLDKNHFVPPDSRAWIDHIRKKGNEAAHELPGIDKKDAIELLDFTEMLLRFVYEMPGRMTKHKQKNDETQTKVK